MVLLSHPTEQPALQILKLHQCGRQTKLANVTWPANVTWLIFLSAALICGREQAAQPSDDVAACLLLHAGL
jgi:hypothetical protein